MADAVPLVSYSTCSRSRGLLVVGVFWGSLGLGVMWYSKRRLHILFSQELEL
jgi:hypothetical protein